LVLTNLEKSSLLFHPPAKNRLPHLTECVIQIQALLSFIYTGSTNLSPRELDRWAESLLKAADKYAVGPLKRHMEKHFSAQITKKNFVEVALLSDTHSADLLKKVGWRNIINY